MFKVPYIKVNDVDQYFALPKKEREHYGFYKVPYGLPCDFFEDGVKGWDAFYEEIRKEYPIQWFFRYWLWSYDNPIYKFYSCRIKWPLRDFYYGAKLFLKPCYPRWRKTLKRYQYGDPPYIIVESNFNLLIDFYEEEVKLDLIDWNSDDKHKLFYKELLAHIKWITEGRPLYKERMEEELKKANPTDRSDAASNIKKISELEKQKKQLEHENLFFKSLLFFFIHIAC